MTLGFPELFSLKNKNVVLTGSVGKLGTRFSHILSAAGANVILIDIEEKRNCTLEKILRKKYNTNPLALTIDLFNEQQVKKMIPLILKKYKKIDALINNAHSVARTHPKKNSSFEDYPLELWEMMTTQNLRGLFLCTREIAKIMSRQKYGVIVNVSSIHGIIGADQRIYGKSKLNSPVSYSATKGAMVSFTKYLAAYWSGKNIRINTLTLGGIFDSKMHTDKSFVKNYSEKTILGRMANVNDYDGAIIFLVSDSSRYMTGANLVVDGGWTAW
jgi:NAD(P)-dependent dehydrogenase (short-subunit alcohol dehydrogenase family)